ncbi:LOW QUALITY PROTEIN: hypothetical protein V2J09_023125 [Rumex salicifolius]
MDNASNFATSSNAGIATAKPQVRICTLIMADSIDLIAADVSKAKALGADLVELRLDRLKRFHPIIDLPRLIETSALPTLVTYRAVYMMGNESNRLEVLKLAMELGADYMVVEFQVADEFNKCIIGKIAENLELIVSAHNFEYTPSIEDLSKLVFRIQSIGADIVKVVTNTLMSRMWLECFSYSTCNGRENLISRIRALKYGGYFTFGALESGKDSAPGQPTLVELTELYNYRLIGPQNKVFGLIGKPVGHSQALILYNQTFKSVGFDGFFCVDVVAIFLSTYSSIHFAGFSCTIPHKESILKCCHELDPVAKLLVSCYGQLELSTVSLENKSMTSYMVKKSTDTNAGSPLAGKTFVVIGAGGAGKALAYGGKQKGSNIIIANRTYVHFFIFFRTMTNLKTKKLANRIGGDSKSLPELSTFHPEDRMILCKLLITVKPLRTQKEKHSHLSRTFSPLRAYPERLPRSTAVGGEMDKFQTQICTPIMADTVDLMAHDVIKAKNLGADLVELRLDCLKSFDPQSDLPRLIGSSSLPTLVTYRPKWEGGSYDGDESYRLEVLKLAMEQGADYVDIEYKVAQEFNKYIHGRRPDKFKLIVSSHNYENTPSSEDLGNLVARIQSTGADIVKIATTALDVTDVARMFQVTVHSQVPVIGLVMGERGLISRILGPKFGGYLTFGTLESGKVSAPGQPTLVELTDLYNFRQIGPQTKVFGIIGKPVGHSKSPILYNEAFKSVGFDGVYVPFLVDDVANFLRTYSSTDFAGFRSCNFTDFSQFQPCLSTYYLLIWQFLSSPHNFVCIFLAQLVDIMSIQLITNQLHIKLTLSSCTIPHKGSALECCNEVDPVAKSIGAVNCIIRGQDDGKLYGYNTDYAGAITAIENALRAQSIIDSKAESPLAGKTFVVIGAGGAGKALAYGAKQKGARIVIANRTYERAKELANIVGGDAITLAELETFHPEDGLILANTTSIGMQPKIDETPVPKEVLKNYMLVFDAVYTPKETRLLKEAAVSGAIVVSGLEMFIGQAYEQFERFTGLPAPKELFRRSNLFNSKVKVVERIRGLSLVTCLEIDLQNASPSVRKQHNSGYKHKANVRIYYQQFEEQQTQSLIDQRIKEHLGQAAALQQVGAAYAAWQQARPPVLPTPMMPMPVFLPGAPGIRPPVLPRPMPLPPVYGAPPPIAPLPLSAPYGDPNAPMPTNGPLPPPVINIPSSDPGANASLTPNGAPATGVKSMYQGDPTAQNLTSAPTFSAPLSYPGRDQ